MDNKHRAILRRNEWYLSKDLEPTKLLPLLHEVLDTTDVQNIKALAVQEDKSKALLDMLQRRGPDAFEVFVKALQTVQPFLAKFLIEQSEKEGIRMELREERTRSATLREELRGLRTRFENETKAHEKTARELKELKSLHQLLLEQTKTGEQDILFRIQELENTRKQVQDALLAERSEKEHFMKESTRLRELCDQMLQDSRQKERLLHNLKESLGNISKKNNELMERLLESTDSNHNDISGYYSRNEENSKETRIESQIHERIPKSIFHSMENSSDEKMTQELISDTVNADPVATSRDQCELVRVLNEKDALKRKCEELEDALATLERQQRTVSFHDRATSPGIPIQYNFEDKRCLRCDALEEELRKEKDCIKGRTEKFEKEIKQLKSKMKELEDDYYRYRQTLQKEIDNTKQQFQHLSQHLEEMSSKQSSLSDKKLQEMRTFQEENGGLKTQVEKLKSEIHKITVELVNEKTKVEKNQQEFDKGKKNLRREKKKAQELTEKIELEKRAKEDLAKEVGILKRDLKLVEKQRCEETGRLGEGLKIEREKCEVLKEEIERWRNLPGRVFNYTKDFDRHGVFYALGTNFGTTAWVNPASASSLPTRVTVTRSSDDQGEAADLLENRITIKKGTLTCTKDEERSWWCVDLSEKYALYLTHYTLRHGRDNGMAIIRNWRLEGSLNGRTWRLLKKHENDRGLKDPYPYYTATWPIDGEVGAFRYFRIFQTGKNSSGRFAVYLSGIELYGVLLEMDH